MNNGTKIAIIVGIVLSVVFAVVLLNLVTATNNKMIGNDYPEETTTTKTTTTYKYTAKITVD